MAQRPGNHVKLGHRADDDRSIEPQADEVGQIRAREDFKLDPGILRDEARQGGRDDEPGDARRNLHAKQAMRAAFGGADLFLKLGNIREDGAGAFDIVTAFLGQADLARRALQKLDAHMALKLFHDA